MIVISVVSVHSLNLSSSREQVLIICHHHGIDMLESNERDLEKSKEEEDRANFPQRTLLHERLVLLLKLKRSLETRLLKKSKNCNPGNIFAAEKEEGMRKDFISFHIPHVLPSYPFERRMTKRRNV